MTEGQTVPAAKREIRERMRERWQGVNWEWIVQTSLAIEQRVVDMDEFVKARVVCCYLAMPREVRTDRILEAAWASAKRICVPAFEPERRCYQPVWLAPEDKLGAGPMGIREPLVKTWAPLADVDLMIVPGVAFDVRCGRLGHGFGHFDRLLEGSDAARCFKAGLAFDFQVWGTVPMESSDVWMDAVATETRCHRRTTTPRATSS